MSSVKINLDSTANILAKRNLEKGGKAQRFFTSEVYRHADKMTPFDTGILKSNVTLEADSITYKSIYARRQYYENKGKGLRGRLWIPRMWSNEGKTIVQSVAKFVGGETK